MDIFHCLSKSPQAHLASYLSHCLSAVFQEIDPQSIEHNLLQNAKLVLNAVRIKPQSLGRGVAVMEGGMVNHVGLTWQWGSAADGSTALVHETRLVMRGIRLQLVVRQQSVVSTCRRVGPEPTNSYVTRDDNDDEDTGKSFRQDIQEILDFHVQQFIDALRLELVDMQCTVRIFNNSGSSTIQDAFIVEIPAAQLHPHNQGREKKTTEDTQQQQQQPGKSNQNKSTGLAFEQRLDVQRLRVDVSRRQHPQSNNESMTIIQSLLEPLAYHVTVRQVSGRRFTGGYSTGLEIVGSVDSDNGIKLHAGKLQTELVTRLLEILLVRNSLHRTRQEEDKEESSRSSMEKPPSVIPWVRTSIQLSLPPLFFVFPNESTVQVPSCFFSFLTDCSSLLFYGSCGIFLDNAPILQLAKGMRWRLDLLQRKFTLHLDEEGDAFRQTANLQDDAEALFYDAQQTLEETEASPAASVFGSSEAPTSPVLASFRWQWQEIRVLVQGIQEFILSIDQGRHYSPRNNR